MNHARLLKLAEDLDNLPPEWKWDYHKGCKCAYARCRVIFRTYNSSDKWNLKLSISQECHIFHPNHQHPDLYGGTVLGPDAPASAVAANIREMVERDKEKR